MSLLPHSPSQAQHIDVFGRGTATYPVRDETPMETTDPPFEVCHVALWRHAWQLMNQHQPSEQNLCNRCATAWPCEPYRHGQADEVASRRQHL
jgi:hypothetical protein